MSRDRFALVVSGLCCAGSAVAGYRGYTCVGIALAIVSLSALAYALMKGGK